MASFRYTESLRRMQAPILLDGDGGGLDHNAGDVIDLQNPTQIVAILLKGTSDAFNDKTAVTLADFTPLDEIITGTYAEETVASNLVVITNPGALQVTSWQIGNVTWAALDTGGVLVSFIMFVAKLGASANQQYPIHIEDFAVIPDAVQNVTYIPNANGVFTIRNG